MAFDQVAEARREGRRPDLSIIDRLPGHHRIAGGTQLKLLDVRTILCHGLAEQFAHVLVVDSHSPLFARRGYITESRIQQAPS